MMRFGHHTRWSVLEKRTRRPMRYRRYAKPSQVSKADCKASSPRIDRTCSAAFAPAPPGTSVPLSPCEFHTGYLCLEDKPVRSLRNSDI